MQKTKLGISAGLLGAAICLIALGGGYIPLMVAGGYVLLCEENEWLKKTVIKVAAIMLTYTFFATVINLIPDCLSIISSFFGIFNLSLYFSFITSIFSVITQILSLLKTVLLIVLGWKALTQGTIKVPFVDNIVDKYMN